MKILKMYSVALLLLSITSGTAYPEELTINVDKNYPPYMYSEKGQVKGIYPKMIKAVFAEMGESVEIKATPWKRLILQLDEGSAGGGGLYFTKERETKYDYSRPIFQEKLAIYTKKGSKVKASSLSDLKGLRVGTVFGWSYAGSIKKAIDDKLFVDVRAKSEDLNFKKLARGRIDAVIAIIDSAKYHAKKLGLTDQLHQGAVLMETDVFIAFNKKANKKALLKKFDEAHAKLEKEGSFK